MEARKRPGVPGPPIGSHTQTHTHTHTLAPPHLYHKGGTIHCGGEDSRGEADTRERESIIEGDRGTGQRKEKLTDGEGHSW